MAGAITPSIVLPGICGAACHMIALCHVENGTGTQLLVCSVRGFLYPDKAYLVVACVHFYTIVTLIMGKSQHKGFQYFLLWCFQGGNLIGGESVNCILLTFTKLLHEECSATGDVCHKVFRYSAQMWKDKSYTTLVWCSCPLMSSIILV